MAVLAPTDWHPPRDSTMDPSAPSAANPAVPRQRSSPANDQSAAPSTISQQQPYPYPVQQQQAAWSPNPASPQFYPAYYQNQPYPIQGQQMHPPQGFYDPTNAQFAQWAHWQMMYNAQQAQAQAHQMNAQIAGSQRARTPGAANSPDYFAVGPGFNQFPSGTPPPHPSQLPNGAYGSASSDHGAHQGQYAGFHPYRRPQRQGSAPPDAPQPVPGEWRGSPQMGGFHPPYARPDAAGSSTSVNSVGSDRPRPRTNSNHGSERGGSGSGPPPHPVKIPGGSGHGRGGSIASATSQGSSASSAPRPPAPTHARTNSSSSSSGSPKPAPAPAPAAQAQATLRKPSPLSQGTFTASAVDRRKSRDDSDLAAMLEEANKPGGRHGGLKGRLKRALSLNADNVLREDDEDEDAAAKALTRAGGSGSSQATLADDSESTATVQKKKGRSLFNSKLNRSTDNISLSSTMSSASMVIRRLGAIGKIARRNSLAGITSLFKDKGKEGEEDSGKKGKKKKGEKGAAADPSISHATAEFDPSEWSNSAELAGLSPAARLARQHTLKSNAEAAAKAKAEAEARAATAAAASAQQVDVPTTWEKNTTTRQGDASGSKVNEVGGVLVEDDSDSDRDSDDDHLHRGPQHYSHDGWDDDEDWGEGEEQEDVTIRADLENATLDDGEEMEPWAMNVRRSVEKTQRPKKGILKTRPDGQSYDQEEYLQQPNPAFQRIRSNSYDSPPTHHPSEPGALALLPSSDPDHIDGIHRNGSLSSHGGRTSPNLTLPPLSFDSNGLSLEKDTNSDAGSPAVPVADKSLFNHPNSSAPALSTMFQPNPPSLTQRSATSPAPAKRLAFATNLSVYDTFPATVYDRRSEPATWSRLTPALAQRIKEELNSYKMEEMEVHAASRIHTQFFV